MSKINVTLPNGTIVEGVPEDFGKEDLMKFAIKNELAKPEDFGDFFKDMFFKSEYYQEGISAGGLDPSDIDDIDPMAISEAGVNVGTEAAKKATMRNFAQGMTFNLADEIEAGVRSLGDETYDEAVQKVRDENKQYEQYAPAASLITQGVGSVVNPAFYGKIPAMINSYVQGAKVAKPVVEAAAKGGTYGAAYGFGAGEGAEGSATSALAGLGFGAATFYGVDRAAALVKGLTPRIMPGIDTVESGLRKYGLAPIVENLERAKSAAYEAVNKAHGKVPFWSPADTQNWLKAASKVADDFAYYTFGKGDMKNVEAVRSNLIAMAGRGEALSLPQVERVRQSIVARLKDLKSDKSQKERPILLGILHELDKAVDTKMVQMGGNMPGYQVARELNQNYRFAETLQRSFEGVELTGSAGMQALRSRMNGILNNKNQMQMMTDAQKQVIADLASGKGMPKLASFLAKMKPTNNLGNIAAHVLAGSNTGGLSLLLAFGVGGTSKLIADAQLRTRVREVLKEVGGPANVRKALDNPESASLILNGWTSQRIVDYLTEEEE